MGMSTHVTGFRPPDEKWKKMKAVHDACVAAGTDLPKGVDEFFGWDTPDNKGVTVDLEKDECCKEYNGNAEDGFEIDVTKLPKDVTVIRFYNAY